MALEANGDALYIGRGKFYFERYDPATMLPSGVLRFVGEINKGDLSVTVTSKERYTTTKGTNNVLANIPTQQKHAISFDLMEFTKDNLALAFLGTSSILTQPTTPITNEVLNSGTYQAGDIYQLAFRTPSSLVLTEGGSTVLVLGVHYEIEDAQLGLIGMLTSGSNLTASYTPAAIGNPRVMAGSTIAIYGKLVFVGDPTNGAPFDIEIWKASFTPSGVLSLLSDDFADMTLTAAIMDDSANHPGSPLYQLTYRALNPTPMATTVTFADTSDGHTYILSMVDGEITVTRGLDGAASSTLKFADAHTSAIYQITFVAGNLTVASSSGAGIPSLLFVDASDGHTYSMTVTDGNLTVSLFI